VDDQIQSFLDAIRAHPSDDGPRLLLADWLDERGDPWGEFIRVQCALASPHLSTTDREQLTASENVHLKSGAPLRHSVVHRFLHRHGLVNHFSHRRGPIFRWIERRGLIAEVEVDAAYLATNASTILRIGPIETVRLRGLREASIVDRLLDVPEVRAVSRLDLRHPSNDLNHAQKLVKERPANADVLPARRVQYIDQRGVRQSPQPSQQWPLLSRMTAPPQPGRELPAFGPEFPFPRWKLDENDSLDLETRIVIGLLAGFVGISALLLVYGVLEVCIHQAAMR
jgi:uncharacterized protein (TIGR02996 family)